MKNRADYIIKLFSLYFEKQNQYYWVKALVTMGEISESEAGYIIGSLNL